MPDFSTILPLLLPSAASPVASAAAGKQTAPGIRRRVIGDTMAVWIREPFKFYFHSFLLVIQKKVLTFYL